MDFDKITEFLKFGLKTYPYIHMGGWVVCAWPCAHAVTARCMVEAIYASVWRRTRTLFPELCLVGHGTLYGGSCMLQPDGWMVGGWVAACFMVEATCFSLTAGWPPMPLTVLFVLWAWMLPSRDEPLESRDIVRCPDWGVTGEFDGPWSAFSTVIWEYVMDVRCRLMSVRWQFPPRLAP
jgi:hypothetical protein